MKFNWGHSITAFFAVFITLAIVFIIFSLKQNNDLVEKDYYKKGADYTSQMKINQRSKIFEDSVSLKLSDDYAIVSLSNSIVTKADTLNALFFRPSDKKLDNYIKTSIAGDNIKIPLSGFVRGRYIVHLSWTMNGDVFMLKKDVFIP
jgi:hypothetical protein